MSTNRSSHPTPQGAEYEAPRLIEIGGVYELTLNGCLLGKKYGSTDGLKFGNITITASSC